VCSLHIAARTAKVYANTPVPQHFSALDYPCGGICCLLRSCTIVDTAHQCSSLRWTLTWSLCHGRTRLGPKNTKNSNFFKCVHGVFTKQDGLGSIQMAKGQEAFRDYNIAGDSVCGGLYLYQYPSLSFSSCVSGQNAFGVRAPQWNGGPCLAFSTPANPRGCKRHRAVQRSHVPFRSALVWVFELKGLC
jgi:hypothetical protein